MPTAEGWFLKGSPDSKEVAEFTCSWGAYKAEDLLARGWRGRHVVRATLWRGICGHGVVGNTAMGLKLRASEDDVEGIVLRGVTGFSTGSRLFN